ncbi:hypothetical protein AURDEDRAFT_124936 [Auricularia subglabra TFB-10046 SS5]|nr:hypothetical protein AURDEDRAFT_124936 [Auricularia subglabra TFB-10046 SS5]
MRYVSLIAYWRVHTIVCSGGVIGNLWHTSTSSMRDRNAHPPENTAPTSNQSARGPSTPSGGQAASVRTPVIQPMKLPGSAAPTTPNRSTTYLWPSRSLSTPSSSSTPSSVSSVTSTTLSAASTSDGSDFEEDFSDDTIEVLSQIHFEDAPVSRPVLATAVPVIPSPAPIASPILSAAPPPSPALFIASPPSTPRTPSTVFPDIPVTPSRTVIHTSTPSSSRNRGADLRVPQTWMDALTRSANAGDLLGVLSRQVWAALLSVWDRSACSIAAQALEGDDDYEFVEPTRVHPLYHVAPNTRDAIIQSLRTEIEAQARLCDRLTDTVTVVIQGVPTMRPGLNEIDPAHNVNIWALLPRAVRLGPIEYMEGHSIMQEVFRHTIAAPHVAFFNLRKERNLMYSSTLCNNCGLSLINVAPVRRFVAGPFLVHSINTKQPWPDRLLEEGLRRARKHNSFVLREGAPDRCNKQGLIAPYHRGVVQG